MFANPFFKNIILDVKVYIVKFTYGYLFVKPTVVAQPKVKGKVF